ncbi:MAG: Gfo/Idh/MocA family oxidoreductase [candidate division WOR-3 bacterium]
MARSIAVIGAGYWGKNLVRVFDELGALACVCDIEPEHLEQLNLDNQIVKCREVARVITDPAIRAVAIATPAATHYELARSALAAGKDVFVEKPLALSAKEGRELVELAEANERVLMVGHILRYHPAVLKLGEMIEAGDLGRIEYIYSNRLNLGKLRTEENILWSFAPHDISVILGLVNERPVAVSSHGEAFLQRGVSDVTLTSIEFPAGIKAHTFVSWLHPFKEQRLVVVGSEQMAVFEDSRAAEKLVCYPHRVEWQAGRFPVAVKGEPRVIAVPEDEPLRLECEHFLESLDSRIPPRTDGWEGLRVLEVLNAAEESLQKNGRVVPLPVAGNGRRLTKSVPVRSRALAVARAAVAVGAAADVTVTPGPKLPAEPEPAPHPSPTAQRPDYFVHQTAVVDEGAVIGSGSRIWHYCHISAGARIGERNILGQNVFVADGVITGRGCKIQNNVSLYRGVVLEDDVFCGPSCVFTNVIDPRAFIEKKTEFRPTVVRRGASIGANATIVCGNTLGKYCLIGAGAVVTSDVPDYALMTGIPARLRGWVCRCGRRLKFNDERSQCRCGNIYQQIDGSVTAVKEG